MALAGHARDAHNIPLLFNAERIAAGIAKRLRLGLPAGILHCCSEPGFTAVHSSILDLNIVNSGRLSSGVVLHRPR